MTELQLVSDLKGRSAERLTTFRDQLREAQERTRQIQKRIEQEEIEFNAFELVEQRLAQNGSTQNIGQPLNSSDQSLNSIQIERNQTLTADVGQLPDSSGWSLSSSQIERDQIITAVLEKEGRYMTAPAITREIISQGFPTPGANKTDYTYQYLKKNRSGLFSRKKDGTNTVFGLKRWENDGKKEGS